MADVVMRNINKIYPGGFQAVYNFSMEIKHGEFIVLVGPSGCGKSTMLRMIAGLESITSGDLELFGKRVNNVAPSDRDIAMVFQDYALYGNMTVYENMGFSLIVRHADGDIIHDRVMKTADVVELKHELNRKPKNLSGGQRQRVALGRSIVRDAYVFLMDEPLSNLDAKLRDQTRKELVKLHEKVNSTFIYVTHDQTEAMAMADRIVIMNKGVVQQIGTPAELYIEPENMFVAGFIGSPSMNFFEVEIKDESFFIGDTKFSLTSKNLELLKGYEHSKVIMGIRPEMFKAKAKLESKITVNCEVVEFMGSEYYITFSVGDGKSYCARIKTSELDRVAEQVTLKFDMDKVLFFDIDTEKRLRVEV